ncbi:MAG TPA: DUF1570 domain-containing protein [Lacipirellulaceae bacterium]|jgi:hypothetical protein|nr:DUF1570 domain-containing protein [Lacipirellulaceae bacterium]
MKSPGIILLIAALVATCGSPAGSAEFMFRARVGGQMLEGKPLSWTDEQMLLLGRDGRLHEFNPKTATEAQKTSPRFFGYSASEMKTVLQQEFGRESDVSLTRHYLVVHPRGERDQWANRFEDLYNRFEHYFRVRGFSLEEPPYPLVAVVFRDQAEYQRHAEASGMPKRPDTLGHYDPTSNRVFLFDATRNNSGIDWSENAATIIHEATHQTAYNVGIHKRFTAAPLWLIEGLATMFEARGMWNAQYDHSQSDRINYGRLADFRKYAARRKPGSLLALLSSDQAFRGDVIAAYAEAWALSFYLCETQPRLYAAYLNKTATRPLFSDYPAAERIADFQEIFGSEMKIFETKFLRYMEEIK